MKRKLRELVAESRTRTLVITVRQAIHASDAGQVGNGLEVPNQDVFTHRQRGLWWRWLNVAEGAQPGNSISLEVTLAPGRREPALPT